MGQRAKYRKFAEAYRELAVRRLRETDNVTELCRDMRISRQLLYQWRDKLERQRQKLDPSRGSQREFSQAWGNLSMGWKNRPGKWGGRPCKWGAGSTRLPSPSNR